jgi:hypothetical protein
MNRLLLLALCALATPVFAVKTDRWELSTTADFLRGKLDRVTVTSDGELRLGHAATPAGELAKEVWCSVAAPDGTLYFGTGSSADIYRLAPGAAAPVKVYATDATAVTALALDANGNLFAGTLPQGKIFRVPAGKDTATEFCRLRAPYIWALTIDKTGALFAGTGPDGKIYRVTPAGKAEEWFAAEEANILCLAWDAEGRLLAGGSDRGLLYRVAGKGQGEVLQEFAEDEIKALVVRDGQIYVGVNKQKARRPRGPGGRRASAGEFEELTQQLTGQFGVEMPDDDHRASRESPPQARLGNVAGGALYVRNAAGRVDKLATWENAAVLCLAAEADGAILAGTAGKARVYRVRGADRWELLFNLDEQQALTLATHAGHLRTIGTGNIGNVYLVEPGPAASGEFTSEVRDCKFFTTWGNLQWLATGAVTLATRTGNTALPDGTWSAWSEPVTASPAKVASPRGRFVQVQARLRRDSEPVLRSVSLYYQIQNQKPEVLDVKVGEPVKPEKPKGAGPEEKPAEPVEEPKTEEARPQPAVVLKRVAWRADSRDGDALVFRVFYRAEGEEWWVAAALEKPLKKMEYWWDTNSVPDGIYRLKVVASDEEANPVGEALTAEALSEPVTVDNRRPEVIGLKFADGRVTGVTRDHLSTIRFLEFAVNGGDWKYVAPADGVFDDREESFRITLEDLKPGAHTVAVRATDAEGNVGVEKLLLRVP